MKQFRKSATATVIGLTAVALLAAPGFAAGNHNATKAGAPIQRVHMGQDQGGQWMGQRGPTGTDGHGMMGFGPGGQGTRGFGPGGHGMRGYDTDGHGMRGFGPGGHGMMGSGPGSQGMMGYGPGLGSHVVPSKDLSSEDVRHFLDHRLEMQGNKRLMLGEVKEADDDKIVADITTVDGALVERLEVDRHTGRMQHVE